MIRVAVLMLVASLTAYAQTGPKPEIVPIDKEPSHLLVFENEYVRVFSVEVAPHSETKYHQHDRDYVGVILGDAEVENVRLGEAPARVQLKDGEARFTKGGFAHKAVNRSDKPFRNVTVELKKGVRAEDVDCGLGKGICDALASGTDHPSSTLSEMYILRTKRLSVVTRQFTGRTSITRCEPNALVIYSALTALDSAGEEPVGAIYEAGKIRWLPPTTSACRYWQLPGRYTQINFYSDETQGPSRQKEGARDDKVK